MPTTAVDCMARVSRGLILEQMGEAFQEVAENLRFLLL